MSPIPVFMTPYGELTPVDYERLVKQIDFIVEIDKLKRVFRQNVVSISTTDIELNPLQA